MGQSRQPRPVANRNPYLMRQRGAGLGQDKLCQQADDGLRHPSADSRDGLVFRRLVVGEPVQAAGGSFHRPGHLKTPQLVVADPQAIKLGWSKVGADAGTQRVYAIRRRSKHG